MTTTFNLGSEKVVRWLRYSTTRRGSCLSTAALLAAIAFTPACSDDGEGNGQGGTGGQGGSNGQGGNGGNGGPLIAICGVVFNPDGPSGYVALVPTLDAGVEIDLSAALEFAGGSTCAAIERTGELFVGLVETPTVQKWSIDADGTFSLEDQVSFSRFGRPDAASTRNELQIATETKAYYFGEEGIIRWNPSTMTTQGLTALDGLDEPDLRFRLFFPRRIGDRFVLPAAYQRPDDTLAPLTRVAFLDIETDVVTYSPADTRCSIEHNAVTDEGDLYLASPPLIGVLNFLGVNPEPQLDQCIIRLRAGEDALDADYFVDPSSVTDVRFAGALAQGAGAIGFTLGYDESIVPLNPGQTDPDDTGGATFRYYGFDLGDPSLNNAPVEGLPPTGNFPATVTVDGVPYIILSDAQSGEARFYDVTDPFQAQAGITAPGFVLQAYRVR